MLLSRKYPSGEHELFFDCTLADVLVHPAWPLNPDSEIIRFLSSSGTFKISVANRRDQDQGYDGLAEVNFVGVSPLHLEVSYRFRSYWLYGIQYSIREVLFIRQRFNYWYFVQRHWGPSGGDKHGQLQPLRCRRLRKWWRELSFLPGCSVSIRRTNFFSHTCTSTRRHGDGDMHCRAFAFLVSNVTVEKTNFLTIPSGLKFRLPAKEPT